MRDMERMLLDYNEQGDLAPLNHYVAARIEWRERVTRFAQIHLIASLHPQIDELLATEERAYSNLETANGMPELQAMMPGLLRQSLLLSGEAMRIVDAEGASLYARAAGLHQQIMVGIITAFAIALMLVLFWQRLMARLLSRVERAVQALGQGRLERKIVLRGPDDLKRIGKRLEWLRCRLLELEEQRIRILRHISHELKTPLAALREGASLLADQVAGALTPQQSRIVDIMHNNALRLQALIDALLRLQQAEYVLERAKYLPFRFDVIIQKVLATQQLAARGKNLQIQGILIPLTVMGGEEELTAIVNNLITNAIKYSPAGGIVSLSLTQEDDQAVLDVIDQGPGIPKEDQSRIFEPFFRVQETKNMAAGIGLGLAITSELVHALYGSLNLLDSPTGAHFQICLPLSKEQS
jgi:two-component system sensor histidine kinase GlrK